MKRRIEEEEDYDSEFDELELDLKSLKIIDSQEEYDLLMKCYNVSQTDDNIISILNETYLRYNRYIKALNLSAYPEIDTNITKYLQLNISFNQVDAFNLMKKIDTMFINLITEQSTESTSHQNKKRFKEMDIDTDDEKEFYNQNDKEQNSDSREKEKEEEESDIEYLSYNYNVEGNAHLLLREDPQNFILFQRKERMGLRVAKGEPWFPTEEDDEPDNDNAEVEKELNFKFSNYINNLFNDEEEYKIMIKAIDAKIIDEDIHDVLMLANARYYRDYHYLLKLNNNLFPQIKELLNKYLNMNISLNQTDAFNLMKKIDKLILDDVLKQEI